jgi:hypothetical protein
MTAVRSCLARVVPSNPTTREELEALRERAWIEQGVVVISPDEIADEWTRQALKNEATKRWGKRMKGAKR